MQQLPLINTGNLNSNRHKRPTESVQQSIIIKRRLVYPNVQRHAKISATTAASCLSTGWSPTDSRRWKVRLVTIADIMTFIVCALEILGKPYDWLIKKEEKGDFRLLHCPLLSDTYRYIHMSPLSLSSSLSNNWLIVVTSLSRIDETVQPQSKLIHSVGHYNLTASLIDRLIPLVNIVHARWLLRWYFHMRSTDFHWWPTVDVCVSIGHLVRVCVWARVCVCYFRCEHFCGISVCISLLCAFPYRLLWSPLLGGE